MIVLSLRYRGEEEGEKRPSYIRELSPLTWYESVGGLGINPL